MWNARRNGRWFGWGCLFLSCSILLFRSAAVLRKNHFLEGKVLLQRAAAQAEQLSVDVMMPLLFYDGKEDGRGWMENLLAAVRDQIPALREGSTAENTLSAGTETAETDTAKQDSFPGPGAERGQTESKEQGTEEDQKDGTQKDETQKDGMEITEAEQTETGITEPAAGESASTAEPEAPQSVPEETIETGGAPREILYPEADTIQETISPDLLADPQALLNLFFVVDPNTSVLPGEIDGSTLLGKDLTLPENAEGPQILIYHTHSQENYRDYAGSDGKGAVVSLGEELAKRLRAKGYQVWHDTTAYDMKSGHLDRSRAYTYACEGVTNLLQKYPSIQVILDVHRDGVSEQTHLVTQIEGKPTAQRDAGRTDRVSGKSLPEGKSGVQFSDEVECRSDISWVYADDLFKGASLQSTSTPALGVD